MRSKVDIGPLSEISSKKRARVEAQVEGQALFEMANLQPECTGLPFVVFISQKCGERYDVRVKVARVAKVRPLGDGSPSLFGRLSAPSEVAWSREIHPSAADYPSTPMAVAELAVPGWLGRGCVVLAQEACHGPVLASMPLLRPAGSAELICEG
jgi:hypothetical protein